MCVRSGTRWVRACGTSRDELIELMEGLRDVIAKHVGNAPAQDRKRHLLSAIVFPASS